MRSTRSRLLIAAILTIAGTFGQAAFAQRQQQPPIPHGKWWRRPAVAAKLQLTAGQQQKLDEVFQASQDGLLDARADVKKLEIDFKREMNRANVHRPVLEKAASSLSAARARMFDRELMMLVEMRTILDDAQWMRLQESQMPRYQRPNGPPPRR